MKVTSKVLAPVVLLSFVIGIGLSISFNLWKTESSKIPAKFSEGVFEGSFNPADIRGSYFFRDIEKAFEIEPEILAEAFGLKDLKTPGDFQVKQLEAMYGHTADGGEVGTDSVRLFVSRYNGLPYIPEETTRLLSPALNILKDKLAPADREALETISIRLAEVLADADEMELSDTAEHETAEKAVKGNTTFSDLQSWGLTREEIEDVLGMEMGPASITIRAFTTEKELEFSLYKERFQKILDSRQ
jgi:hypothetical protein